MKLTTCLAAVVFGQQEVDGFWKNLCCRRYRVEDNRLEPIYDGLYELVGKHPENPTGRPLFQHEDEKTHLYYTPESKLWRLGVLKGATDLNDYKGPEETEGCPNLGNWGDDVVIHCEEKPTKPPTKTTKKPGTGPTKPGPTKPGPTKPGPTKPGPRMCCTTYDVVDDRNTTDIDVSGTYEIVKDEKKNDRPLFKNVDEFFESGLFFHMWYQPDKESWQIGDKDALFEVPTITASESSHCPLNGDWGDGLEVTCAARPPKPTPKPTGPPKHECCKRYSVEGDDWEGMYLFKGMMNEAPIYVNPDHMFGITKMLYLCDECKKWVFGYTKDPTDDDTLISAEIAKCPHEADFGGLKVNCLDEDEKPEPETCLLKKSAKNTGKCVEIGEQCSMKTIELTDGNNEGSRATVTCRQHYRMNLPYEKDPFVYGKKSTYAYCKCGGSNGECGWEFTKGAVQCTLCPVEQLQARNGKKQKYVEWDTGIAIYYPIKVDVRATEGWHVALDFNAEIGNFTRPDEIVDVDIVDVIDKDKDQDKDKKPGPDKKPGQKKCAVRSGNMKLTSVSKNGRIWTFTPNVASLSPSSWSGDKKVYLLAYFDNMTKDDIEKAKKATLLFFKFKMPRSSASCLVDRFDRYPLQPDEEDDNDEDEQ